MSNALILLPTYILILRQFRLPESVKFFGEDLKSQKHNTIILLTICILACFLRGGIEYGYGYYHKASFLHSYFVR